MSMEIPKPFKVQRRDPPDLGSIYFVVDKLGAISPVYNSDLEARQECARLNGAVARGWRARDEAMKENADV